MNNLKDILNFQWLASSIAYDILKSILLVVILGGIYNFYKVITIVREILKENRITRGNGFGKHLADRFIEIWYSIEPEHYFKSDKYYMFENNLRSRHCIGFIDNELKKLGLIGIDIDVNYGCYIVPIKNRKNKLVILLTEFYLINFAGDSRQFYKHLKIRKKHNK